MSGPRIIARPRSAPLRAAQTALEPETSSAVSWLSFLSGLAAGAAVVVTLMEVMR